MYECVAREIPKKLLAIPKEICLLLEMCSFDALKNGGNNLCPKGIK